ncbi:MAG: proteasome accessory factor PafA2 family protein [Pirellulales bacterium]|nr:proteasome accessory factor PafA2 family protein [Pirellulales bacterium]
MSVTRLDRPMILGTETELAVNGAIRGNRVQPEVLQQLLLEQARQTLVQLPANRDHGQSGLFLENGGRLYGEINGVLEFCSAECSTPEELVLIEQAHEQILRDLAAEVCRRQGSGSEITIVKNNVGPIDPDRITRGNHESFTAWWPLNSLAEPLMAFLVTRLPYAGSGCLSGAKDGSGYELSQRARHLTKATGSDTTGNRAIFSTRVRNSHDRSRAGWRRVHLIGKDSSRCPWNVYYSAANTAVLLWVINHGGQVGAGLVLENPVHALQTVSGDPFLKAELSLADGRRMTALEIQSRYLDAVTQFVHQRSCPAWITAALERWGGLLSELRDDPLSLAGRLDAYTKLRIVLHELDRSRATLKDIRLGVQLLKRLRTIYPEPMVAAILAESPAELPAAAAPLFRAAMRTVQDAGRKSLDRLRLVIRLIRVDFEYHRLGGLFEQLVAAGGIDMSLAPDDAVVQAKTQPPAGTRAAARAQLIRELHTEPGWSATWGAVAHHHLDRYYELENPFTPLVPPRQSRSTEDRSGLREELASIRQALLGH